MTTEQGSWPLLASVLGLITSLGLALGQAIAGTRPGETDTHAACPRHRKVEVQVILAELIGGSPSEVEARLDQIVFKSGNHGRLILTPDSGAADVLIRALQAQGRIDILSRTHGKTSDGEPTVIQIGYIDSMVKGVTVTRMGPGPLTWIAW